MEKEEEPLENKPTDTRRSVVKEASEKLLNTESPERKNSNKKNPDNQSAERNLPEHKIAENILHERGTSDNKIPDNQTPEIIPAVEKIFENVQLETKTSFNKIPDNLTPEINTGEHEIAENKSSDKKIHNNKSPERTKSDWKILEGKSPERNSPERKIAGNQTRKNGVEENKKPPHMIPTEKETKKKKSSDNSITESEESKFPHLEDLFPDDETNKIASDSFSTTSFPSGVRKGLMSSVIIPTDKEWYVVAISFFQNLLKDSVPLCILVLSSIPQPECGLTVEERYIIGAVFFGLTHTFSPIACGLINFYLFKSISIIGPAIAFISFVACYFLYDSFFWHLFILGFFGSFGCSLFYCTGKFMPVVWFCNKRDIACQISDFGLAVGILLLPFIVRVISGYFEIQLFNSYLFFSGLYVPLIVIGFFVPKVHGIILHILGSKKEKKVKFRDQEAAGTMARTISILDQNCCFGIFRTYNNLTFPRVQDVIRNRSVFMIIPREDMMVVADHPFNAIRRHTRRKPSFRSKSAVSFSVIGVQEIHIIIDSTVPGYGARPFYRSDIFYCSNVLPLNVYYRQTTQLDYHMSVTRAMTKNDYLEEAGKERHVFPEAFSRTIITLLDCRLWGQLYFIALQLGLFLYYTAHFIPFIFIKDRGLEFGLSEADSFSLIYFIGVGNIFGRAVFILVSIYFTDLDHNFMFEIIAISQGFIDMASNMFNHYTIQAVYCVVSGLLMGVSTLVKVPCIGTLIGIYEMPNVMGYEFILRGLGIITGIIMGAYLNKSMNSVQTIFFVSGVCCILGGILLMPVKKFKSIWREGATDIV